MRVLLDEPGGVEKEMLLFAVLGGVFELNPSVSLTLPSPRAGVAPGVMFGALEEGVEALAVAVSFTGRGGLFVKV